LAVSYFHPIAESAIELKQKSPRMAGLSDAANGYFANSFIVA
jgi:hypothetical protein